MSVGDHFTDGNREKTGGSRNNQGERVPNRLSEVDDHVPTEGQHIVILEIVEDPLHLIVGPILIRHLDIGVIPTDFRSNRDEAGRSPIQTERDIEEVLPFPLEPVTGATSLKGGRRPSKEAGVILIAKPFRPRANIQRRGEGEIKIIHDRIPMTILTDFLEIPVVMETPILDKSQIMLQNVSQDRSEFLLIDETIIRLTTVDRLIFLIPTQELVVDNRLPRHQEER